MSPRTIEALKSELAALEDLPWLTPLLAQEMNLIRALLNCALGNDGKE